MTATILAPDTFTIERTYDARHEDIVPNERMITSYHMYREDVRISVSLSTVRFVPAGTGTRLIFTEHVVCMNGYEDPGAKGRAQGVGIHLGRLATYLAG